MMTLATYNSIQIPQVSWTELFLVCGVLIGVYILLQYFFWILSHIEVKIPFFNKRRYTILLDVMHDFLMWYEPFAIIILSVLFILVDPVINGLFVLLILLLGFGQIRNYVYGKFIKVNNQFEEGAKVTTGNVFGYILKIGNTGLYLQESEGIRFVPYYVLISQGYSIISGRIQGVLLSLKLERDIPISKSDFEKIKDICLLSPYLERNKKHSFELSSDGRIECIVQLKRELLKPNFIRLIEENNFKVTTIDT